MNAGAAEGEDSRGVPEKDRRHVVTSHVGAADAENTVQHMAVQ